MTCIFDCGKYILEQEGRTPVLMLQKLLYYAQAWSLAWDRVPLFPEDFEAWPNGPMYPPLHWMFEDNFDITAEDMPGDSACLTEEQKETIDVVLESYGTENIWSITHLSMGEDPWIQARKDLPPDAPCSIVIPKDVLREYFSKRVA